jgi:small nuclear ribonucleoprotein (snRNP)-like protein
MIDYENFKSMTVKELKEELNKFDDNLKVVISDVDEGIFMDGLSIEEENSKKLGKILVINGWYDFIS